MTPRTIRLPLYYPLPPSENDGVTLEAWKGNPLNVQFGIFNGPNPASITDITSVTMLILASQTTTDAALASSTDSVLTTIPNKARWESGSMQNGTIEFTAAQMNQTVTDESVTLWYVVYAVIGGGHVVLGSGPFVMYRGNDDPVGSPPSNPAAGITQTDADGRYLLTTANGATVPKNKGGAVTLTNSTSSGTVTFGGNAFATPPTRIQLTVETTDPVGALLFANSRAILTTGFSYELSGEVPASGTYKLHWEAIL